MKKIEDASLQLEIEEKKGVSVIYIHGTNKINAKNYLVLKDCVKRLLKKPNNRVIVDFSSVEYVDSSGFGALISALKTSKENESNFKICNVSEQTLSLINLMKLDSILDIQPDIYVGINSF
jgi:anti-sigma B factor antagonist